MDTEAKLVLNLAHSAYLGRYFRGGQYLGR